ncbi:DUF4330 domain-containing protein [Thermosediminibacter litoriperuensis]|uniref:Uncharacterized protein DUF4330 n=1 Tax=Thermosediminibacter litoriperuensis TaxID=291989 RepID=A0A5S5AWU0_9FIRM|nr:DUF4330 domain-containing protein [Thermosediminibacter litoriperuensis]TYP57819.1 uncharacterized protein DUF4330 [Thermosediminibacter litoriperuensis]
MSLIDKKGRLFGLINIIDLMVILLIVAVAGRFALKAQQRPVGSAEKKIEVVLLVKDVRDATASVIKEGDIVRETKTNNLLGKITKVEVRPAETLVNTADGRVVSVPNPVLKDVYVTLEGSGTAGENAIVIGGTEIRIGTVLQIKTNIYSVVATVMGIKVLD